MCGWAGPGRAQVGPSDGGQRGVTFSLFCAVLRGSGGYDVGREPYLKHLHSGVMETWSLCSEQPLTVSPWGAPSGLSGTCLEFSWTYCQHLLQVCVSRM